MDFVTSVLQKKKKLKGFRSDWVVFFSQNLVKAKKKKRKGLQPTNFERFCGVFQRTNKEKMKDSYLQFTISSQHVKIN